MRNRWIALVAFLIAASILIVAQPAYTALAEPSAIYCDPQDADNGEPHCTPIRIRRLPVPTPSPAPESPLKSVLPFTYGYVMTGPVALYSNPADMDQGAPPVRMLNLGYVWVRIMGQVTHNSQAWYLTEAGGYLPSPIVAIMRPSAFHGITVGGLPATSFAWVLNSVQTSPRPGDKPTTNSANYKRYDVVNLYEQQEANKQTWYRVGDNQWLVQTVVAKVEYRAAPPEVGPGEKWIDVSLFEQTLAAYEGNRMVYATLISSGLPQWATVKGVFRIHTKYELDPMTGREGKPDYYSLEGVPWSMYFYQDYALHGAYWHDGFGWQHSHGCVNLAPLDAKWLFEWTTPYVPPGAKVRAATKAEPGTWVSVHD
jgi:lipoprotein-anchoring transpeptidase ErfK/SrfK